MKPNYLIIGAAKCGTTNLWDLFGSHPEIFIVRHPKEVRFFSSDQNYARGWGWYESLFEGVGDEIAVGENTPGYTSLERNPHSAERIAEHLPDVKLIYIVRHPFERIESDWIQRRTTRALRVSTMGKMVERVPSILDITNYQRQINAYRRYFSDDQILVLFLEDMKRDQEAVLRRCWEFLGVDPSFQPDPSRRPANQSAGNKRMDSKTLLTLREKLPGYYRISQSIPMKLRRGVKDMFLQETSGRREKMDAATKQQVVDRIGDDLRRFLEFCGKPADFWDLRPSAADEPRGVERVSR